MVRGNQVVAFADPVADHQPVRDFIPAGGSFTADDFYQKSEFGFQVVGPVSTASGALAAARESHFDAAVLDINLGDGLVYTVAEILEKRGVPFVFVTGYDADSVDPRFGGVPVLQKPIERDMLQKIFMPGADRAAMAS